MCIDTFHNKLNVFNRNILNVIKENFSECDNFDFFDVYNYSFYLFDNDILIVSSSALNSIIILNSKTFEIYNVYNNAVIYNAYANYIIVNNDINSNIENSILSYFKGVKVVKINSFINILNLQGVYFSKDGFSEKELETLRRSGAIIE